MYHTIANVEYKQTEYGMKTVVTMDTFFEPDERMTIENLTKDVKRRFAMNQVNVNLANFTRVLRNKIVDELGIRKRPTEELDEYTAQLEAMKEQAYVELSDATAGIVIEFLHENYAIIEALKREQ